MCGVILRPDEVDGSVKGRGDSSRQLEADIAIIGSGPGGATLAWSLRESGASVLLIERGDFLPREWENWDPESVHVRKRYRTTETWDNADGGVIHPGLHYYVGGNSKMWGAALPRFMPRDFERTRHADGDSPEWPFSYADIEPYYERAEELYGVHGDPADWGAPPRRNAILPAVEHEPAIADLIAKLEAQGLHPFHLPVGIDRHSGGRCVRCDTCDSYPCMIDAKNDADVRVVRPALESPSVTLATGVCVERLETAGDGSRITSARGRTAEGEQVEIRAATFAVACGAANSAALLLRSANAVHPNGVANSSGHVGRNYMHHVTSAVMAVDPRRRVTTRFQKTISLNDFYGRGREQPYPLGNIQGLIKLRPGMLVAARRGVPRSVLRFLTDHSVDLWVQTEDLPDPENRVTLRGDRIVHRYRKNNRGAHEALLSETRRMLRRAGYPLVFVEQMGIETNSHQCGTCRAGTDPGESVVDANCRAHDVENLYVVDASFFPSSAALNPGLTIAANALRVADQALIP
jgi:choline dehydrogenase-like flavoprotein